MPKPVVGRRGKFRCKPSSSIDGTPSPNLRERFSSGRSHGSALDVGSSDQGRFLPILAVARMRSLYRTVSVSATVLIGSWSCKNAELSALPGRDVGEVAVGSHSAGFSIFSVWKQP